MGVPFLLHEDHLDVSPTRSTFSFGSFSGLGDDRRPLDRGGWQATIMGEEPLSSSSISFSLFPFTNSFWVSYKTPTVVSASELGQLINAAADKVKHAWSHWGRLVLSSGVTARSLHNKARPARIHFWIMCNAEEFKVVARIKFQWYYIHPPPVVFS